MEYLIYILIFVFGIVIGSFLNVCIYRLPEGLSIVSPPSSCPSCKTRLKPLDLFPVFSWLALKGKCRYCKEKIPARYMLVELLTGVLFLLVYVYSGLTLYLLAALLITAVLIAVTFIDIDTQTIPNGLIIFGIAAGLVFVFTKIMPGQKADYWQNALDALYGLLVGFAPLFLVNILAKLILKKDGMGGGDMKLMAMVGLFLGLKLTILALILAIYIGGIIGAAILLDARIKDRKRAKESDSDEDSSGHYMAFGPFLAIGSFVSMLFGSNIIEWYVRIILN